ncbi:alpha/beta hydrolase [Aeromonas popoffii]|uniref:Alpha/beta hydrolase n=1 Tax=Aeromonas popoffii TaxID=70856 RepID=A0ABS5GM43_9GAMM|nr:alpha/beta hydrolase [Aeromonas popoffii]MBR7628201.1 alpha/beta hydrolase [Aeromonas popoffii]
MQSQTHTFLINGSPLPCLRAGSGEPLLLIHGALANHTLWLEHIEQLSHHYTVYAPTLRHFGEAGKEGPFGLETHANDLLALLAQLACGPVHLVGWSYGADVALTAALMAPERFQSLYLVEPGCPGTLDEHAMAAFMADAGAMFGPVFGQVGEGLLQEAVATLIDGSGGHAGYFAAQPLKWQQAQLAEAASLPKQLSQRERPDWSPERLAALSVPTCIVQGADTRALFALVCEALGNAISACTRLLVPHTGHLYPIEQPTLFVQHLQRWLTTQR